MTITEISALVSGIGGMAGVLWFLKRWIDRVDSSLEKLQGWLPSHMELQESFRADFQTLMREVENIRNEQIRVKIELVKYTEAAKQAALWKRYRPNGDDEKENS